jgi:uncharacterized phage-associated protein
MAGKGREEIRMRVTPEKREKFAQVVVFFASKGLADLTNMKLAKLIYFADKRHLQKYGRTITGDTYYGMEHGPVPSAIYSALKNREFADVVECDGPTCGVYPVWRAIADVDPQWLSDSDEEVLVETFKELGRLTARELRDRSHTEVDVKKADAALAVSGAPGSVPIPIEDMLLDLPTEVRFPMEVVLREEMENEAHSLSLS